MSRVKAFSQNSLFLEQFWREFRISFWCHKPLSKTKRLENDTFELLTTFSFYSSCLILLIMRSWTGRSSHVRGKKNFKMHLKITKLSTEARLPTPRYGQYLTHVHKPVRAGKRRVIGLVWELLSWVMGSWAGINKQHLSFSWADYFLPAIFSNFANVMFLSVFIFSILASSSLMASESIAHSGSRNNC